MPHNPPPTLPSFSGQRILVVEDEMMVAMLLEELLTAFGLEIVGPTSRLGKAAEIASNQMIDAALLDVNIAGDDVYPVAKILAERGIPFTLVSGYAAGSIDTAYRERPRLQKPFTVLALERSLRAMLG